ncbi:hypothetical protein ABIC10_001019 [Bradyrhizobium sp. S3.2.12]
MDYDFLVTLRSLGVLPVPIVAALFIGLHVASGKAVVIQSRQLQDNLSPCIRLRLEFHYTPKHASWLNMVEIEIGVLRGQCLDRRIDNPKRLRREITAWERGRNAARSRIKWMFTTDKARAKWVAPIPPLPKSQNLCAEVLVRSFLNCRASGFVQSTNKIAGFGGLNLPIPAISNASASEKPTPAQSLRSLLTDDQAVTRHPAKTGRRASHRSLWARFSL